MCTDTRSTRRTPEGVGTRRFALSRLLEAEAQRARLARALHDDVGQMLMALNLGLFRLSRCCGEDAGLQESITSLRSTLGDTAKAVRRLAADFRPVSTHAQDLRALLITLVEQFRAESGLACVVTIAPEAMRVSREYSIALCRILPIALTGIAHRRLASRPRIRIGCDGPVLFVVIRDEAVGARDCPAAAEDMPGLPELREWITALEGVLYIGAGSGRDGLVRIELPLSG